MVENLLIICEALDPAPITKTEQNKPSQNKIKTNEQKPCIITKLREKKKTSPFRYQFIILVPKEQQVYSLYFYLHEGRGVLTWVRISGTFLKVYLEIWEKTAPSQLCSQ